MLTSYWATSLVTPPKDNNIEAAKPYINSASRGLKNGRLSNTIDFCQDALEYLPNPCSEKVDTLQILAKALYEQKKYSLSLSTIDDFLLTIDHCPSLPEKETTIKKADIFSLKGKCYERLNQLAQAFFCFNQALSLYSFELDTNQTIFFKKYRILKALSEQHPQYRSLNEGYKHLFFGLHALEAASFAQGIKFLTESLRYEYILLHHRELVLFHIGLYNLKLDNYAAGLDAFKAVFATPTTSQQRKYITLGNVEEARAWHYIGACYLGLKDFKNALYYLTKAEGLQKLEGYECTKLFLDLALCLLFCKKFETAKPYYNAVIQNLSYQGMPRAAALFGLAQCYKAEKNYSKASALCNEVLHIIDSISTSTKVPAPSIEIQNIRENILNTRRQIIQEMPSQQRPRYR